MAFVVSDIITASISLEQAPAEVPSLKSTAILPEPDLVPLLATSIEGDEQPADVQHEEPP